MFCVAELKKEFKCLQSLKLLSDDVALYFDDGKLYKWDWGQKKEPERICEISDKAYGQIEKFEKVKNRAVIYYENNFRVINLEDLEQSSKWITLKTGLVFSKPELIERLVVGVQDEFIIIGTSLGNLKIYDLKLEKWVFETSKDSSRITFLQANGSRIYYSYSKSAKIHQIYITYNISDFPEDEKEVGESKLEP